MAGNDDLIRAVLQKRAAAASRAQSLSGRQRGLDARAAAQFNPTVGGGGMSTSVGGRNMQIPQEEKINWGGIIGKGIDNYQASANVRETEEAQEEAQDAEFDVANAIYESTLQDDPEGAKLIKMTQMGVPGAEQALAKHLTPKTQSLAVLVQAMTSGKLDPEMAAELAPQFGVSPEMVKRGAAYATEVNRKNSEQKFQQQAALKSMGRGGSRSGGGKLSFDEYQSLSPEDKAAYDRFSGIGGRNAKQDGMTPGERNQRMKKMLEMDDLILTGEQQMVKGQELEAVIDNPRTFGTGQKVAQMLSDSDLPIVGGLASGIGVAMRSEDVAMMENYVLSEVLDRMAKLGGSDSNEELRKMRASLPSALNNQKAAKTLFKSVQRWQEDTLRKIKARRETLKTGEYTEVPSVEDDAPSGKIEILEILD